MCADRGIGQRAGCLGVGTTGPSPPTRDGPPAAREVLVQSARCCTISADPVTTASDRRRCDAPQVWDRRLEWRAVAAGRAKRIRLSVAVQGLHPLAGDHAPHRDALDHTNRTLSRVRLTPVWVHSACTGCHRRSGGRLVLIPCRTTPAALEREAGSHHWLVHRAGTEQASKQGGGTWRWRQASSRSSHVIDQTPRLPIRVRFGVPEAGQLATTKAPVWPSSRGWCTRGTGLCLQMARRHAPAGSRVLPQSPAPR